MLIVLHVTTHYVNHSIQGMLEITQNDNYSIEELLKTTDVIQNRGWKLVAIFPYWDPESLGWRCWYPSGFLPSFQLNN